MSGGGWQNPVVGGTAMRIPAIQSPNFSIANQTGWQLLVTGLATFFGLTLTGGNVIITNNGGIFIYSGTPALGNLIGSWAGAAGTDTFGNVYPKGINVTTGTIAGSTFTGADFIINQNGYFTYSGTPALGNLVGSWASAAGADSFGNSYTAGPAVYGANSSAIVMAASGSVPGLFMTPQSMAHLTQQPQVVAGSLNAGAVNEIAQNTVASGKESSNDDAAVQMFSESADGTIAANVAIEFGGTVLARFNKTALLLTPQSSTPTPSGGAPAVWSDNNGGLGYTDGQDGQAYKTGRRTLFTGSNSGSLTSLTTIFSSSVNIFSGASTRGFRISGALFVNGTANAQLTIELNLPSGSTGQFGYEIVRSTTLIGSVVGGVNSSVGVANALASATGYYVPFDGIFFITTNGTFNFQVGSLTATGLVVAQNSFIDIMPL